MAIDLSKPLTDETATRILAPLFFDGKEASFAKSRELRPAREAINASIVHLIRDEDIGTGGDALPNLRAATANLNRHLSSQRGTLPPFQLLSEQVAAHLFAGNPLPLYILQSNSALILIKQPAQNQPANKMLASISGLPEGVIHSGLHVQSAEVDNLVMLTQLREAAQGVAALASNNSYPNFSNPNTSQAICFILASSFFEREGGNPLAIKTYQAARMVGMFAHGALPMDLLGFLNAADLQNAHLKLRFDVFVEGQETPPQSERERERFIPLFNNGLQRGLTPTPSILARGLKGALDGIINTGPYGNMSELLADYAIFCSFYRNPLAASAGDKKYVSDLSGDKFTTLSNFHVIADALAGLKQLTGPQFSAFYPDRSTDALLARIAFAATPHMQAGRG